MITLFEAGMFFNISVIVCTLIMGSVLFVGRRRGEGFFRFLIRRAISPLCVFSFFVFWAFPARAYIIAVCGVDIQAVDRPDEFNLALAVLTSTALWLVVCLGWRYSRSSVSSIISKSELIKNRNFQIHPNGWIVLSLALMLIGASLAVYWTEFGAGILGGEQIFIGGDQNEHRYGNGPYFFAFSLYSFAGALIFSRGELWRFQGIIRYPFYLTLVLLFFAAYVEMVTLNTRRPLFLLLTMLFLSLFAFGVSRFIAALGLFTMTIGAVLMSPIMHMARYPGQGSWEMLSWNYSITIIGSTFEGAEHLANYLSRISFSQFIIGVDQGISWLFNMGLSFFPRQIWSSKPVYTGAHEQQFFIYPNTESLGTATLPPSVWVDFLYGFGVFGALAAAFGLGVMLRWMDNVLFSNEPVRCLGAKEYLNMAMATTLYVNLFNVARAGTGVFNVIVPLVFMVGLAIFFSHVFRANRIDGENNRI